MDSDLMKWNGERARTTDVRPTDSKNRRRSGEQPELQHVVNKCAAVKRKIARPSLEDHCPPKRPGNRRRRPMAADVQMLAPKARCFQKWMSRQADNYSAGMRMFALPVDFQIFTLSFM
ncbi:unnamed protein product [Soboliphyme baturini]|uniref:Uncharacterized protein n=1 Tax=Soboliphyme baturini TaxID=241478 RepID=A0A183IZ60_9BILA|nr:unnamed protein product [Soboliphyme baturini]